AAETGAANTVDPFGGAYAVEAATNRIEDEARALLARIDAAGGTLAAIEQGLIQRDIQESAYRAQQQIDSGERIVVGVNRFAVEADGAGIETLTIDPELEAAQIVRLRQVRAAREQARWSAAVDAVRTVALGTDNLVPPIIEAVEASATVGEISDALRGVFGEHREIDA
ncbi:MAG: methylmalonyl-CoA mutase family protein, partial [Acidobacteriota bacterium]